MAATGYPAASPLGPVRHAAAAAPDAAGALYDRSAARVYRFCHRIVSDADAAEDAVQATLVAALAALGTGFDVEADPSWLLALAETTCRLGTHHARVSRAALALLPGELRDPLRLRDGGASYGAIAEQLGCSRADAERRVFLARCAAAGVTQRRGLGLASLASALKSLLGGVGAKIALVAVVAAGTVAVPLATTRGTSRPRPAVHHDATPGAPVPSLAGSPRVRPRAAIPTHSASVVPLVHAAPSPRSPGRTDVGVIGGNTQPPSASPAAPVPTPAPGAPAAAQVQGEPRAAGSPPPPAAAAPAPGSPAPAPAPPSVQAPVPAPPADPVTPIVDSTPLPTVTAPSEPPL